MKKKRCVMLTALFLVVCVASTSRARGISAELQNVLGTLGPGEEVSVIVTLRDRVDLEQFKDTHRALRRARIIEALKEKAELTQKPLRDFLLKNKVQNLRRLWILNAMALRANADVIRKLADRPEIEEIRLDVAIPLSEVLPGVETTPEWNLDAIRAPDLWKLGYRGQGVVVASMDTGVDANHSDLASRRRGGDSSWYDPHGEHAEPFDSHPQGHGTACMGILVGGHATGTAIGVAPDARWIAVKIFNDAGQAPLASIHEGFQWLLDPDGLSFTDDAPDVVINPWGFRTLVGVCYLEFQQDIQALQASEIAVVFSAGNEGPGPATSISPANNPESFAVGATDPFLNIAAFSSRGPSACVLENDFFPEVVSPGVNIKSADLTFGGLFPNSFSYVSGTSYAAPHVAGAMALLLSAFPDLTVSQLESALKQTAMDLGDPGPDNAYGYGLLDVLSTYRALVPCTDTDKDGYYAEAVCGTEQDCNDIDAAVYPGAPEIKRDAIDQDCNGYDLTIEILKAVYFQERDTLFVEAESQLNKHADLELVGYGPMSWNSRRKKWHIRVRDAGGNPETITVSGIEGSESAETTVVGKEPCEGDFDADGDVDGSDLSVFAGDFGRTDCGGPTTCPGDFDDDGDVDGSDLSVFAADFGRTDCP